MEKTWNYKKDELAFLFSLNKQKKYNIKNDNIQYAIHGYYNYFSFGYGYDLYIYDQCTSNNNNYCYSYSYNTKEKYELSGGQSNFYVDEMEVYNVEFE